MPPVVARPCSWVASLNAPQVAPPWARAVFLVGSTSTACMPTRSITTASSAVPNPGTLCDPPRTAMARPPSRAKFTAATTSSTPSQRTMTRGRRSIMALYTLRASSYPASSGVMISPRTWSRRCAIAAVAILSSSGALVMPFLLLTGLGRNPPSNKIGEQEPTFFNLNDDRARVRSPHGRTFPTALDPLYANRYEIGTGTTSGSPSTSSHSATTPSARVSRRSGRCRRRRS